MLGDRLIPHSGTIDPPLTAPPPEMLLPPFLNAVRIQENQDSPHPPLEKQKQAPIYVPLGCRRIDKHGSESLRSPSSIRPQRSQLLSSRQQAHKSHATNYPDEDDPDPPKDSRQA